MHIPHPPERELKLVETSYSFCSLGDENYQMKSLYN